MKMNQKNVGLLKKTQNLRLFDIPVGANHNFEFSINEIF